MEKGKSILELHKLVRVASSFISDETSSNKSCRSEFICTWNQGGHQIYLAYTHWTARTCCGNKPLTKVVLIPIFTLEATLL
jgi:hypothetical protein